MQEPPAPFLIVSIVTWLMSIIGAVAIGFIVWGAWGYVMSAGNEKKIEEAKRVILYAIIGFVIAILAVVIVQTIGGAVGGGHICKCNNCKEKFPFSSEEECDANCDSRCNGVCGSGGGKCVSAEEAAGEEHLCPTLKPGHKCIPTEKCWDDAARKCKISCPGYTCIREKKCNGTWCCGNNPGLCCCKLKP